MKIKNIKINNFGNLENKNINLENKLNVIYGNNEAGKSTLLKFIISIFFGVSKNKKGKELTDFEKYKPWSNNEYSGKLIYELDNKNTYEIFREFDKKNPKIFDENLNEVSKNFNISKNKGNEFFAEQTKINEEILLSTVISLQNETQLNKNVQNELIQRLSNTMDTGEEHVSFKKIYDKLNKKLLENVGTEKSQSRPINNVQNELLIVQNKINELKEYKKRKIEINELKNKIEKEKINKEIKIELINKIKRINEEEKIEKEKIKINEEIELELEEKIENINNEKSKIKINKQTNKLNYIILIIVILINALNIIFIKNKLINLLIFSTVPVYLIYYLINKLNNNKLIKKAQEEINLLNTKKEILQKEKENKIKEINKLISEINLKYNLEKNKIINKYENKIKNLEQIILNSEINLELEKETNNLNEMKIKINTLEIEEKNIIEKLDDLINMEEKLFNLKEEYYELNKLRESINLAKEILEKAYNKLRSNITPKFTQNLSNIISEISDGKYNSVKINESNNLIVELENGNYINLEHLSTGTIEQLYLALRLSLTQELIEESMPIILDETFVYYDNNRLKRTLLYLTEKYSEKQIILLTCSKREIEILNEFNIEYNLIKLE